MECEFPTDPGPTTRHTDPPRRLLKFMGTQAVERVSLTGSFLPIPPTLCAFSVGDALKALRVFARAASSQRLRRQPLTRQRMYPTVED